MSLQHFTQTWNRATYFLLSWKAVRQRLPFWQRHSLGQVLLYHQFQCHPGEISLCPFQTHGPPLQQQQYGGWCKWCKMPEKVHACAMALTSPHCQGLGCFSRCIYISTYLRKSPVCLNPFHTNTIISFIFFFIFFFFSFPLVLGMSGKHPVIESSPLKYNYFLFLKMKHYIWHCQSKRNRIF